MKTLHVITWVLVIIGGLNWLCVAFGFNLVDSLFGTSSILTKIVYILVGLSALFELFTYKKDWKTETPPQM